MGVKNWYKVHHFEEARAITQVNPYLEIPQQLNDLIMAYLEKTREYTAYKSLAK